MNIILECTTDIKINKRFKYKLIKKEDVVEASIGSLGIYIRFSDDLWSDAYHPSHIKRHFKVYNQ